LIIEAIIVIVATRCFVHRCYYWWKSGGSSHRVLCY